ncbi:PfkB family carbohydrate kinase [Rhodoferax sp.]|uniref:PfkB family carbohydrate kinase n=1 Tax=Rhodoferax sp. TaxID=50421 RepID=UPI00374DD9DA
MNYLLAVGASNMDVVGHSAQAVVPGDSNPGHIRYAPGGVARNVAENLARLGHRTQLVSVVGDDIAGRSLLVATADAGVDMQACWVLPGETTSSYVSLHGPDGDMALAVNDMRIVASLTPERLAPLATTLAAAQALLLDCNLQEDALAWLCTHSGSTPVFVDTVSTHKCQRIAPWLHRVQLLKPNRLEAQALTGLPLQTPDQAPAVARWLHQHGVQQVVLSCGAQGVFWSEASGAQGWHAAPAGPVANTSGAGDALMAGLMHGYALGHSLAQAVAFASACAALTLRVEAANHPELSVASVQHWLSAGSD